MTNKMSLEIFKYPSEWNGGIKCDKSVFEPRENEASMWEEILEPYVNVCVDSPRLNAVMADCALKLNAIDGTTGTGVFHELVTHSDNDRLMKMFLEIGANPENSTIEVLAQGELGNDSAVEQTGLSQALLHGREKCVKALVEVGVEIPCQEEGSSGRLMFEAVTCRFMPEGSAKELIKHKSRGPKSIAELSKNGTWYAVRYLMRTGKATLKDIKEKFEGRTAVEWVWFWMSNWQLSSDIGEDALVPFKIFREMKFRFKVESPMKADVQVPLQVPSIITLVPAQKVEPEEDFDSVMSKQTTTDFLEMLQLSVMAVKDDVTKVKDKLSVAMADVKKE